MNNTENGLRRGIILDVDGTLWDAVEVITESWNLYGKDVPDVRGEITCERMRGCLGKTMPAIADEVYDYLPRDRRLEVLQGELARLRELVENGDKVMGGKDNG